MDLLSLLLNLPWTIMGIFLASISIPISLRFKAQPYALIFRVSNLNWWSRIYGREGVRAAALGNVILLGQTTAGDLEHELMHIKQAMHRPLIHPFLYLYESLRHGYRNNKYEQEAYAAAGSPYIGQ